MTRSLTYFVAATCVFFLSAEIGAQDFPDIRSIASDLSVPDLSTGRPLPGKRFKEALPAWKDTEVYHVLFLPENWEQDGERLPVLVEWGGNGGYENEFGDTCNGRPEGCKLGYGLSAGRDFIWLSLPYLNAAGDSLALKWWGDAPTYDPQPTLAYGREALETVCRDYHGDPERVVLCGFSRGALACNYLGLQDERTSDLWCGFFAYSHYDGVRNWPYPGSDRVAAKERLQRLQSRPQFVCAEGNQIEATRRYLSSPSLASTVDLDTLTSTSTGFRNHNDAWILRPSLARTAARKWLFSAVQLKLATSTELSSQLPVQVLDLSDWKLTIPFDTPRPGKPDEVLQPELDSFTDPRCFYLSAEKDAVLFRAACGSPTTKGSSYPRSELRQMSVGGEHETQWSTDDNQRQVMSVEQAVTALPLKKPHVVCAQIHDADDDLLMIRLEKKKLFIEREGQADVVMEPNYQLGQRFQLQIAAGEGRVEVWYNGELKLNWPVSRSGCYFKVGCYTQSNLSKGDEAEAYGEVAVYALSVAAQKKD